MVMALHPTKDLTSLKVLDCCCGTGGFLVSWLNNLAKVVRDQEEARYAGRSSIALDAQVRSRIRNACTLNMYGLDINPFLVRTCQMNLVLHGDGSSNVFRADSVRSPGEWDDEARRKIPYGEADVVFTNPPFGGNAQIDDAHILDKFELPLWDTESKRNVLPAEQLFVEAALKFVRPGGYMAIVLPDGILNNPGLRFIRTWLLKRSKLIASVSLPKTTFKASGGVNNPSLVLVKKFTNEDVTRAAAGVMDTPYEIFMAIPHTAGLDNRAKPVYLRHADGREQLDSEGRKIIDDEISSVPYAFQVWMESQSK